MSVSAPARPARPPLESLVRYFLRLGSLGFGGPIALVGAMREELVDKRCWFSSAEFEQSMTVSQLAPGPLAAQVAFCLGYQHSRLRGAAAVGLAFILPAFLLTLVISILYLRFGGLPWLAAAFYGVGAAVIGIIVVSAWRLARSTAGRDPLLWAVTIAVAVVTAWQARELVWVIALGGLLAVLPALTRARPGVTLSIALLPELAWYFTKAGAFVFGSGLAIVPFLYSGVVTEHRWLTERQFLDAIAVAMLTPGPVVITAAFIGYLVAGPLGSLAATLGVFLPAFVLAILLLPLFDRAARHPLLLRFVRGVTAAAAGAIVGACVVLGRRAIADIPTALLALTALLVVGATRIPAALIVCGAAVAGLLLHGGLPG